MSHQENMGLSGETSRPISKYISPGENFEKGIQNKVCMILDTYRDIFRRNNIIDSQTLNNLEQVGNIEDAGVAIVEAFNKSQIIVTGEKGYIMIDIIIDHSNPRQCGHKLSMLLDRKIKELNNQIEMEVIMGGEEPYIDVFCMKENARYFVYLNGKVDKVTNFA